MRSTRLAKLCFSSCPKPPPPAPSIFSKDPIPYVAHIATSPTPDHPKPSPIPKPATSPQTFRHYLNSESTLPPAESTSPPAKLALSTLQLLEIATTSAEVFDVISKTSRLSPEAIRTALTTLCYCGFQLHPTTPHVPFAKLLDDLSRLPPSSIDHCTLSCIASVTDFLPSCWALEALPGATSTTLPPSFEAALLNTKIAHVSSLESLLALLEASLKQSQETELLTLTLNNLTSIGAAKKIANRRTGHYEGSTGPLTPSNVATSLSKVATLFSEPSPPQLTGILDASLATFFSHPRQAPSPHDVSCAAASLVSLPSLLSGPYFAALDSPANAAAFLSQATPDQIAIAASAAKELSHKCPNLARALERIAIGR